MLPSEQEAIRTKCFHPSGVFTPFPELALDYSVPDRFDEVVHKYPDRIAIETVTQKITYAELARIAGRLSQNLIAQTGSECEPVAISTDSAIFAIASHVGVLKAGKMSVFLDPSDAASRINHILENSQPSVLITDGESSPALTAWDKVKGRLIHLDSLTAEAKGESRAPSIRPDAPAYIRYTSGSTGQAKGAIKTHRHILHSVQIHTNYFYLCENDRFAILGRDFLGKRSFEALLNGATLYPFDVKRLGLHRLADWLIEKKISICKFFPTAFRHFLTTLSVKRNFKDLRLVQLEGEPLYPRDIELYKAYFSNRCMLVNSYSSTETGPISFYLIDKDSQLAGRVPIGYPIDGIEIKLVDDVGEGVGPNEVGEIVIRSAFLSPGYWRADEVGETQSHWRGDSVHGFAYFTGDLGSMNNGGCLEHVGRKDSQVKIRGFRVDTGEVEAALSGHPGVRHAAVTTKQGLTEERRLVAYIIPNKLSVPTVSQLRNYLDEMLPTYMIPTAFVVLDALPLTATGKIDYRALPDPPRERPNLDAIFVAPHSELEKELASVWASILGVNQIGVHDSFLDIGGHSLAATRIVAEIIRKFQIEIPLQSLFEAPTIADMAAVVTEYQGNKIAAQKLAGLLADLESLSDADAKRLLDSQEQLRRSGGRRE